MATFVILSRISPTAFGDPKDFNQLAKTVSEKIKKECPGVKWKESFATFGRFDVVDVVESDDPKQVARAAMIIRAYGKSETETLPATPWKDFLANLSS
ncbi:MAG: GYD domain-containing protein [Desulfomonile tiedjei]|nr:GYD domain-containing protein [Desulfomonile tiedjei]